MWECSTPFVFMRWGLHTLGRTHSKLYLYNGLTMMAVFFICRNVMGIGKLMQQPPLVEHRNLSAIVAICTPSLYSARCTSSFLGSSIATITLFSLPACMPCIASIGSIGCSSLLLCG